jgi:hypothetical protein
MFLLRGGLIWLEAPVLSLLGPGMSWQVRECGDPGLGMKQVLEPGAVLAIVGPKGQGSKAFGDGWGVCS